MFDPENASDPLAGGYLEKGSVVAFTYVKSSVSSIISIFFRNLTLRED